MKFTHEGFIVGCDARTPKSFIKKSLTRETKTMWCADNGRRFNKRSLLAVGEEYPLYKLKAQPTRRVTE